ncbi:hypothetical protein EI94DRAFT_325768 [Lactarius quietus]|nr:hypothetical protein EI94DRAFT_325768 [Lactarius quietus]
MESPSDPQPSQAPSLLLQLAGPLATKADIARLIVIAEASKGSKFYERKDEEVTARIGRIIKLRDQVVKGVDIGKVEQKVDRLVRFHSSTIIGSLRINFAS